MMNATGISSWRDQADWVQFEMNGKQFEGVLWMMPMSCGVKVKVVAEKFGENRYFAYAVQSESDAVVAIYPNAIMGRSTRGRFERKGTLGFFVFMQLLITIFTGNLAVSRDVSFVDTLISMALMVPAGAAVILFIYFLAKWKFRNSIEDELAESIFKAFGWPDPQNLDLQKVSQWPDRERPSGDLPVSHPYWYFKMCYFRYDPSSQALPMPIRATRFT